MRAYDLIQRFLTPVFDLSSFLGVALTLSWSGYPATLQAQSANQEIGGVYFRIDDVQPMNLWKDYSAVFQKYGLNFCFALNLGKLVDSSGYQQMIKEFQAEGNEMMDHTPDHSTAWITVQDTLAYLEKSGIDHIYGGDTVCLSIDYVDTTVSYGEGLIDLIGHQIISLNPKEFDDYPTIRNIYIGSIPPHIFTIYNIRGNITGGDTAFIKTIWNEPVNLPKALNVEYHKLTPDRIYLSDSAFALLAERTLSLCDSFGIERPYTWIEPGGAFPNPTANQVVRVLANELGYTSAATSPDPALKSYGECYPTFRRYSMGWNDFSLEDFPASQAESIIADKVAKHYVVADRGHFTPPDGWSNYLGRLDSLLDWLKQCGILVKTQTQWAHLLYDTPPDSSINIFPPMNVDLDHNGVPDGYDRNVGGKVDSTDGPLGTSDYSYAIADTGSICSVTDLGGLIRPTMQFSLWTKGCPGDSVKLVISYDRDDHSPISFTIPATTSEWHQHELLNVSGDSTSINIPDDISALTFNFMCSSYVSGDVKIGGFSLRKAGTAQGVPGPSLPVTFNIIEAYPNPFNPSTTLLYSISQESVVNLSIYDILGRRVKTIQYNAVVAPGEHSIVWSGAGDHDAVLASGAYLAVLRADPMDGGQSIIRLAKLTLLK
jgi:FlgD Ig-like domain